MKHSKRYYDDSSCGIKNHQALCKCSASHSESFWQSDAGQLIFLIIALFTIGVGFLAISI